MVTNAIVTWNTVYMNAAIERLRAEGRIGRDIDLGHLSPALYGHVNLYGKYPFEIEGRAPSLRPLRSPGNDVSVRFCSVTVGTPTNATRRIVQQGNGIFTTVTGCRNQLIHDLALDSFADRCVILDGACQQLSAQLQTQLLLPQFVASSSSFRFDS